MDSNIKLKTIKLLEKNVGENIGHIELGKEFLDLAPKTWSIQENWWGYSIKMKKFCL